MRLFFSYWWMGVCWVLLPRPGDRIPSAVGASDTIFVVVLGRVIPPFPKVIWEQVSPSDPHSTQSNTAPSSAVRPQVCLHTYPRLCSNSHNSMVTTSMTTPTQDLQPGVLGWLCHICIWEYHVTTEEHSSSEYHMLKCTHMLRKSWYSIWIIPKHFGQV